jgi:ADP-heptose:LPS heptosyltransferase
MILLHAYAQSLRNGMPNPKNYPFWADLLSRLDEDVVQIGIAGDVPLVDDVRIGLPLTEIRALVASCDYWISVDSFLPHLAHHLPKPGVVLWSVSDPDRFGYPENLNLLRDRSYLRPRQFRIWEEQTFNAEAFMPAEDAARQIQAWRPLVCPVIEMIEALQ